MELATREADAKVVFLDIGITPAEAYGVARALPFLAAAVDVAAIKLELVMPMAERNDETCDEEEADDIGA